MGVDNEPLCAESHRLNFEETPFYLGSISDFVADLRAGAIPTLAREPIDLIVGGPPCPPYSKSRFYRKEKPRALRDDLAWETINGYLDTLRLLEPRAFLLENVAGLAYKVHREALDLILRDAEEAGYRCTWRVVNAADHGVPQIRERLILVGVRDGVFTFPAPTHAKIPSEHSLNADLPGWRTAGEVLTDLDSGENADDTGHFAGGQFHHLLRQVPPGDNYLYFTAKRNHPQPLFKWRSRYWNFLLKLDPKQPAPTIQAQPGPWVGPFHWHNRRLRLAEIKRLQTFPDDYEMVGSRRSAQIQIGNAVPPRLAEQIALALLPRMAVDKAAGAAG
jgi:DNA (cytosine-5)-methyltransferase 1